jgi:hypothetical protein
MADFVFNCAKGRVSELTNRVAAADPAHAQLVLVPLSVGDTAANLRDLTTLAAVLAATPDEQTGGGWARKTGRASGGDFVVAAATADNTNDLGVAALPQVTWTAPTVGSDTVALLVCYDSDSTGGTDTNVIPLTYHDFAVTADGTDVVLNAGDYCHSA